MQHIVVLDYSTLRVHYHLFDDSKDVDLRDYLFGNDYLGYKESQVSYMFSELPINLVYSSGSSVSIPDIINRIGDSGKRKTRREGDLHTLFYDFCSDDVCKLTDMLDSYFKNEQDNLHIAELDSIAFDGIFSSAYDAAKIVQDSSDFCFADEFFFYDESYEELKSLSTDAIVDWAKTEGYMDQMFDWIMNNDYSDANSVRNDFLDWVEDSTED